MSSDGRLRVLWVIHYPVFGGPHNRVLRLYGLLAEAGIDVTVVLPSAPGNARKRFEAGGVPVISMPLERIRATRSLEEHRRLVSGFRFDVRRLRGAIRLSGAEVMVVGGLINTQGPIAARLEGIGLVWQVLDSRTPKPLSAVLMTASDRLADVVTFAGPALVDMHPGADRLGIPTYISTPGVDTARFVPSAERRARTRERLGIPAGAPVVGTVANVNRQKSIEVFIRAASLVRAAVPDARFVVVGEMRYGYDEYVEFLRGEIEAGGLGDAFHFAGEQSEVEDWYPAFDVKVMSSGARSEGTPTSILEAWACEVAVVATNVGSVAQLVQDGENGALVEAGDHRKMADETIKLLGDDSLRSEFAAAGRRRVEAHYSIRHVADVHEQAIRQARASSLERLGTAVRRTRS
ncbi:MAG TPA: glycosyltransferase family 4 protein [Solirubrobacterales bacterium]|jgi:glycosyltransferase involved in cell wall biosynthesis|nr:glycosyltransferase family 4 protein [Solirubrobacterales bacterium]